MTTPSKHKPKPVKKALTSPKSQSSNRAQFRRIKIKVDQSLGQKLNLSRKRQKLSIEDIEEQTKIRTRYLEAIERDDYRHMPGSVYVIGFLRRFADTLGLDPDDIVRQYRSEQGNKRDDHHNQNRFMPVSEVKELGVTITPKTFIIILIVSGIITLGGYIGWQIMKFSEPPAITIESPTGDVSTEKRITVKGHTSETAKLTINGQSVEVGADGGFNQIIGIGRGINTIEIKVANRLGRESIKVLKIFGDFPVVEQSLDQSQQNDSSL
jgi:transcriptional regulator with XRE-family HTH domain